MDLQLKHKGCNEKRLVEDTVVASQRLRHPHH